MYSSSSLSSCLQLMTLVIMLTTIDAAIKQPFSTTTPTFPNISHPLKPLYLSPDLSKAPIPTNRWWQNLVVGDGTQPIVPSPYALQANPDGVDFNVPVLNPTADYVMAIMKPGFTFGSTQSYTGHEVIADDLLSVTLKYNTGNNGGVTFPIVRGSAYITALYDQTLPVITTINAILQVNDQTIPNSMIKANKLKITCNDGTVYFLYSSITASWQWTINRISVIEPTVPGPTWIIRMAVVPQIILQGQPSIETVFDTYSSVYPTGGDYDLSIDSANNAMYINFTFQTANMNCGSNSMFFNPSSASACDSSNLLMTTLPHHMDMLQNPQTTVLKFGSLFGNLTTVVGSSWILKEQLPTIQWSAPSGVPQQYQSDIITQLQQDATATDFDIRDSYTYGKCSARMLRLAVIADELQQSSIASDIRTAVEPTLEKWMNGSNLDPLLYDTVWGGIVTTDGIKDQGADYGNGWYNDHHFHYGYFLYTAASIIKENPSFASQYKEQIYMLARDIANPSSEDPYFPVFRHFDIYAGHSWASGLFAFGDGRNQESSSEAINAWYGLYLLGVSMRDTNMQTIGSYLLASELRASRTYWQIKNPSPSTPSSSVSTIYPSVFASNMMAGMVWSSKVVEATFFASGKLYVHCINMLPFTPITEYLLLPDYVSQEYPVLYASLPSSNPAPTDEWLGFVYMDGAVIDPMSAWKNITALARFDNGNTRTNTMYWIATRPSMHQHLLTNIQQN